MKFQIWLRWPVSRRLLVPVLAIALAIVAALLITCSDNQGVSSKQASTAGIGPAPPGGGFGLLGGGGEDEIPPLTWWEGSVSSIECSPPSFDPAVGQETTITAALSQQAELLVIRILNSLDEEVKALYSGSASSGDTVVDWDGTDGANNQARYSIYLADVTAWGMENEQLVVIGSGQSEVILYRPKAGVSLQDADKYRNEDGEYLHSGDEWVAAGLLNPGDSVAVSVNGSPVSAVAMDDGIFKSAPFMTFVPNPQSATITVYPYGTETSYDIEYDVYLNRIHFEDLAVLLNGEPVQHSFDYFVPENGEVVQVDYSLDAAEDDIRFFAVRLPDDNQDNHLIVRSVNLGSKASGAHYYIWDGTDDEAQLCAPGSYSMMIMAVPDPGDEVYRPAGIWISKFIDIEEGS